MKGFKSTGNGPRYGGFKFPAKAGFGPSSGSVRQVSGYSRKVPKRKAVGGLVKNSPPPSFGFQDFAKGGPVRNSKSRK